MLVDIRVCIPEDPQGAATSEQVLDGIVEALNKPYGERRFWAPPGTRVEGVGLSMPELTEARYDRVG